MTIAHYVNAYGFDEIDGPNPWGFTERLNIHRNKNIYNNEYVSCEKRMASFNDMDRENFPCSPREFAMAGFYRDRNRTIDSVQCFLCGMGLYNWELTDNPWIAHHLHNRNCEYVKMNIAEVNNSQKYKSREYSDFLQDNFKSEICKDLRIKDVAIYKIKNALAQRYFQKLGPFPDYGTAMEFINDITAQKIKDRNKTSPIPDNLKCIVCCANKISIVNVPCGHQVCCSFCGLCFNECIICRKDTKAFMKTYFS